MRTLLVVMLLLPLVQTESGQPAGDVQAGKAFWERPAATTLYCRSCHGDKGQGAFAPDLAHRGLSVEQFKRAVRQPWGIMPAFTEQQMTDQNIADLAAYFDSLPKAAKPGEWLTPMPANAPLGQQLLIAGAGCGQCHTPTLGEMRVLAGAVGGDFSWFQSMVYEHATVMPEDRRLLGQAPVMIRMGNYSRLRLPEGALQEMWGYITSLGLRPMLRAQLSESTRTGNNVTYAVNVENLGLPGKGLAAEDLSIALTLPAGVTVTDTTGHGYVGVRHDQQANADTAVWQLSRIGPKDKQTYAITLLGTPTAGDLRGIVRWTKPAVKDQTNVVQIIPPPQQTR
jgi:mono/diheme cytochrome c family protein